MIRPPQRIAYLGQMADVSTENGISKKIRGQITHWLHAGHEVRYFSQVPTAHVWPGFAPVETELITRGPIVHRMMRSLQLCARLRTWRPDAIYFRYAYHSPGLPGLFREIPTIAEINSDDLTEYPVTLSPAKVAYHRLTRSRILRACAGFVPVTRELGQRFAAFNKPKEVIANGIDLAAFTPAPPPAPDAPLRLIFIGSAGTPWHGLERVAELARLFPDAIFDIVGDTRADAPPNMRFHGELERARYEPLVRSATAAIGTLALYRKKMQEACPLKTREYLALGLPVIGAYDDTDIPADADYFLRVPNDDASLAPRLDAITSWLAHWRARRVPREAVSHLDNSVKETQRLEFLAQFAQTSTHIR